LFALPLAAAIACGADAARPTAQPIADAGTPADAAADAALDAAEPDASEPDAAGPEAAAPRVDVPALACNDAIADVYVTPHLPPFDASHRGDVVRCALDAYLTSSAIDARIAAAAVVGATPAVTGAVTYRIAYRTTRPGGDGASTALVFLPHAPIARPAPVVVIGHPTTGLADPCAPSRTNEGLDNLALPWIAAGYAVIVPDYAGLGNGGVQRYLDARDAAYTMLDAVRAMRKLMDPGALAPRYLGVGFSQGGGAVLSMQAFDRTYGEGGLAAAVAISPEWQTRINSFGFVDMMRAPTSLTITTGISKCVVAVMRSEAFFDATRGAAHAGDMFPASKRDAIVQNAKSICFKELGAYVQAVAPHLGDLFDDAFRAGFLACVDGGACAGAPKDLYDYLAANVVSADPRGAPILYVQGLLDSIMRPDEEAACNVAKLAADGVAPELCVDGASDHGDAPKRNVVFALRWAAAVLSGASPPACDAVGVLPPCSP